MPPGRSFETFYRRRTFRALEADRYVTDFGITSSISDVRQLIAERGGQQPLPDKNTSPKVYYTPIHR